MLLPVSVIFSNNTWTFWNVFLLFFLWFPLLMMWGFAIFDVFRRNDLKAVGKIVWVLVILIFPWIGTLVYLIARPKSAWGDDPGYGYGGYGYGGYGYAGSAYGNAAVVPGAAPGDPAP